MGCNPLPAAMARAGWELLAPSFPETGSGCGAMEGSGTRAMLVARHRLAGIAPKGSSMLGSWQQDLLHWGGFVRFFLGGFPKNGAFCNPHSLSQNFSWQNLSKTSGNSAFERCWG